MEQLLAAWKFARPLCLAHQVISYQHIVRNLEPASKHELEDGLCEFARQLLKEFP